MIRTIFFLALIIYFSSCSKCRELNEGKWFEAGVIEIKNMDCGYPLIQFAEADIEEVQQILGNTPYGGKYIMKGLPSSLHVLGSQILIHTKAT